MDIVGAVASIGQLTAYGQSATKALIHLYKAVQNGPAAFQEQKSNVCLLLKITERICRRTSLDNESILLLFVQITDSVHGILRLLEQKGVLGINWVLVIKSNAITDALESLSRKRELLQLHVLQEGHELLSRIHADMSSRSKRTVSSATGVEDARIKTPINNFTNESPKVNKQTRSSPNDARTMSEPKVGDTMSEVKPLGSLGIEANKNKVGKDSHQNIANGWGECVGQGSAVEVVAGENEASDGGKHNIANYHQDSTLPEQ